MAMKSIYGLQRSLDYIEEHLDEPISLDEIVKQAYLSQSQFYKLFSLVMGCPVKDYIVKRRLSKAAQDLVNTHETIMEIAVKYQYNCYETFSRAFKKLFNSTPADFRKKSRYTELYPRISLQTMTDSMIGGFNMNVTRVLDRQTIYNKMLANEDFFVLCIDIDHFASYNDNYGRDVGDIILVEVANRIEKCIKEQMSFYRIGGDEFIVLTGTNNADEAKLIAESIIRSSKEKISAKGHDLTVKVSIGVARRYASNDENKDVISEAQSAMFMAKKQGKDQYCISECGAI